MNDITLINNKPLAVKEYQGQRVITFKDIDELHERPAGTAHRNFKANKKRYIEKVDYFLVKPSDVRKDEIRPSEINESKIQNNEFYGSEINNRGTIFLTESGYLMSTKSLNDDLAWQVQRELVNNYFRSKEMADIQQLEGRIANLERLGKAKPPQRDDSVAEVFFDILRHAMRNGYYLKGYNLPNKEEKASACSAQKLLGAITYEFYYIISSEAYSLYTNNVENPMSKQGLFDYLSKCRYMVPRTTSRWIGNIGYRVLRFHRDKVKL